ncbi:MAG: ATP-binding protein [Candidatus Cryptobacteroides sp.]
MDSLFDKHAIYLAETPTAIIRAQMYSIDWDSRLISIKGPKGVGKSTLMKQFIKLNYPLESRKALYCSADSFYFTRNTLVDLADGFVKRGGERLFIDEIHKYEGWSREIKEIYDLYPKLKVVISGSSLLQILGGDADLSRRCISYTMQGLSFREYLLFAKGIELPKWSLEEILSSPWAICEKITNECSPLEFFTDYMLYGYYPYYFDNPRTYFTSIENVVNYTIDYELPAIRNVDVGNVRKIKALLYVLANNIPFQVDISKLAGKIGIERNTLLAYLKYLDEAKLIKLLYSDITSVKKMQKPDKIFIDNNNLLTALSEKGGDIGTKREIFSVNQLSYNHKVEYGKTTGDFKIDGRYLFEIGGKDKTFDQIAALPDSYIFADDIDRPSGAKLPLWLLGFLY